ncbi:hypothetical protein PUN28_003179 [Cardiocondyla obscurior]|uniref:Uncharacterized protein n=1 Tax=Cardiocondyla obscurior TaxID=286306 RepID=A0AAW2GL14_9HYME
MVSVTINVLLQKNSNFFVKLSNNIFLLLRQINPTSSGFNALKKSVSLISFLSMSTKMMAQRDGPEMKERFRLRTNATSKLHSLRPRLFLNFDPRNGGYEIRRRKMLPISRDRTSQQPPANGGYSFNGISWNILGVNIYS